MKCALVPPEPTQPRKVGNVWGKLPVDKTGCIGDRLYPGAHLTLPALVSMPSSVRHP
jgi:hypothetical protein